MRVLVTGGAGFVGSNLVRRILATRPDWRITVVDLVPGLLGDVGGSIRFIEGDVSHPDLVERLVAATDAVVHLAEVGTLHGPDDMGHITSPGNLPEQTWPLVQSNVLGTYHLLEAVRRHGVRLHVGSSCDVEVSPTPYAATKASAEMFVRAWTESYGVAATMSRSSAVYGPWQPRQGFGASCIITLLDGLELTDTPSSSRLTQLDLAWDWIHVDDHSDAIIAALEFGRIGEIYLLGAGAVATRREVRRLLTSIIRGPEASDAPKPLRAYHRFGPDLPLDSSSLRADTGWTPRFPTLRAGLEDTVAWYREHGPTTTPASTLE